MPNNDDEQLNSHEQRDDSSYFPPRHNGEGLTSRPWFVFRREFTLGTLITVVAWLVFGVIAWTRIGDRLDYIESEEHEVRAQETEMTKALAQIEQTSASQTAVLQILQDRQRADEDQIYQRARRE